MSSSEETKKRSEGNGRRGRGGRRYRKNNDDNNKKKIIDGNLRERLTQYLMKEEYECMICFESIRKAHQVWTCDKCYAIYHLHCIRKWSESSIGDAPDTRWRCPGCQFERRALPKKYFCFCGKMEQPRSFDRSVVPHSCGNICGRLLSFSMFVGNDEDKDEDGGKGYKCPHKCALLCHPGPCPPCKVMTACKCYCGKSKEVEMMECWKVQEQYPKGRSCGSKCLKQLQCGRHKCQEVCHSGACKDCDRQLRQNCYCGNNFEMVPCGTRLRYYSCKGVCLSKYECGQHVCQEICHPGKHRKCPFDPQTIKTCPCGKLKLKENSRSKCTDEIPTCEQVCGRVVWKPCGHEIICMKKCHTGPCLSGVEENYCVEQLEIFCRCKATSKIAYCKEQKKLFLCANECRKMKQCGKHRCKLICCDLKEHLCDIICDKPLQCGIHRCQEHCHKGKCANCKHVDYTEWSCPCGNTTVQPPIRCGTHMPTCPFPCMRPRPCGHATNVVSPHTCHPDSVPCPPCMIFTQKPCICGKTTLANVPCSSPGGLCHNICQKPLPCGHSCPRGCHDGDCLQTPCQLPCDRLLPCGHKCPSKCHPECSKDSQDCKESVQISCPCGNQLIRVPCASASQQTLQCSIECQRIQRNRQLASALKINPDSKALRPRMPVRVKLFCQQFPNHSLPVAKELFSFLPKLSDKQPFAILRFPPMRSSYRQFIHVLVQEFCATLGLESEAVDAEPHRSVVIRQTRPLSVIGRQSFKFAHEMLEMVALLSKNKNDAPVLIVEDDVGDYGKVSICSVDHFHLLSTCPSHFQLQQEQLEYPKKDPVYVRDFVKQVKVDKEAVEANLQESLIEILRSLIDEVYQMDNGDCRCLRECCVQFPMNENHRRLTREEVEKISIDSLRIELIRSEEEEEEVTMRIANADQMLAEDLLDWLLWTLADIAKNSHVKRDF